MVNTSLLEGPEMVQAIPRIYQDLTVLLQLMMADCDPKQIPWTLRIATTWYIMRDTSGNMFIYGLFDGANLVYKSGKWYLYMRENISIWREDGNLVCCIIQRVDSGDLNGVDIFLYSDNMAIEGTYYKSK